ncbi:MAG TPA: hypothetical protein VGD46_15550 [Rhizobacter sp.]
MFQRYMLTECFLLLGFLLHTHDRTGWLFWLTWGLLAMLAMSTRRKCLRQDVMRDILPIGYLVWARRVMLIPLGFALLALAMWPGWHHLAWFTLLLVVRLRDTSLLHAARLIAVERDVNYVRSLRA